MLRVYGGRCRSLSVAGAAVAARPTHHPLPPPCLLRAPRPNPHHAPRTTHRGISASGSWRRRTRSAASSRRAATAKSSAVDAYAHVGVRVLVEVAPICAATAASWPPSDRARARLPPPTAFGARDGTLSGTYNTTQPVPLAHGSTYLKTPHKKRKAWRSAWSSDELFIFRLDCGTDRRKKGAWPGCRPGSGARSRRQAGAGRLSEEQRRGGPGLARASCDRA